MEQVIMKKVLEEMLEEQKNANAERQQVTAMLEELAQQVKMFDSKLSSVRLNVPAINTSSIEHLIKTQLQTMNLSLDLHVKKVEQLHQKKEFEEQVFSWLPWAIVVMLCIILIKITIGR